MLHRHTILTALLFLSTGCTGFARVRPVTFRCAGSVVVLADSLAGAKLNVQPDAYTRELTAFDLSTRLNNESATQADYLHKAAASVRRWPAAEQQALRNAFASLDSIATALNLNLHLPDTVWMIKTTCAEEYSAEGYTRGARIMLNTSAQPIDLHLVAHELWHVISRANAALRDSAYAVFHFRPCNNIEYKRALGNRVITNPDCPWIAHYVTLTAAGKAQDATLVLYSNAAYRPGGTLDDYASIGVLFLEGDDAHKHPATSNGKPVIMSLEDVPGLAAQVGSNTPYMLHIEEIVAEHFAAVFTGTPFREMSYVQGVKAALAR